jgi:ferrochelatase
MTPVDQLSLDQPYDALLFVSFGGPESREDVLPFLENVTRGRNVPRERLLEVAEHYYHFGGASPINAQNRELILALERQLAENGPNLPIYFGNRNWAPYLKDTVAQMAADGVRRALAFCTSAFSSYSGCRQYRENLAAAQTDVGRQAPQIDKLRVFFNHPLFIEATVDRVTTAIAELPESARASAPILFTAHSIPASMAANCRYESQLNNTAALIAERLPGHAWQMAYQSRSGPPSQPWLEPDICDALRALAARGEKSVVIAPIGFLSDHLEVLYDLDVEARAVADELGLAMARAATVGTHPSFVAMIREMILERTDPTTPRRAIGELPPVVDVCPVDCCLLGGRP